MPGIRRADGGTRTTPAGVVASGWGWRYASRRAWAVAGATLRIEPGERVLLLGASGSGKSTLLHALAGVLGGDDEGESTGILTIDGREPGDVRGRAGMVLQDPDSQAVMARVGDDVAFGCENLGVPRDEIASRVRESVRAVGLDVPLAHPTSALSGGQKQRLALAAAVAMRPGLLLLDEPTANLDPAGTAEVRDAVAEVLETTGATLVVVEHRLDVWLPLVDRVIVLGGGGVLADGSPAQVLGEHGRSLAAGGVWVPDFPPRHPAPPVRSPGGALVRADRLQVSRSRGRPIAGPLDLEVREGEVLAITGANGAGKSTLGLTLAGLLRPEAGAVVASPALAAGAKGQPTRWSSRQLLTRIGTVLQDPEHQLLATTVRRELEVGPRALGHDEVAVTARVDDLLARLRLDHVADANPYTLSGGEKRRLTVGAMLATRPRVLVLDEPTFGQDAVTWREMVALIADVRDDGAAVVVITHDADVLAALHARPYALAPAGGAS
ncbi:ATP-binding cassette domain-containing protein [Microbacterium sp. LRZ72]|uniref:ABC transporter ATP-binding protein n=1 Tax=Microbacterium sp. LRZ72 TaxID=2942481 RepID=UPI0029B99164|nr:ATP-binding cassette domain-containing protein [Microbacterium sp. LRZ72]MDX2376436.1 ATP-binding cassette domain-containing protein [Microbacterium sp. LRZ72]